MRRRVYLFSLFIYGLWRCAGGLIVSHFCEKPAGWFKNVSHKNTLLTWHLYSDRGVILVDVHMNIVVETAVSMRFDQTIVGQVFDRNSDGYVSKSELYHTLKELGVNLSLEELNSQMKEADTNQDGCIDYAGDTLLLASLGQCS
jgi:hypothetical protein